MSFSFQRTVVWVVMMVWDWVTSPCHLLDTLWVFSPLPPSSPVLIYYTMRRVFILMFFSQSIRHVSSHIAFYFFFLSSSFGISFRSYMLTYILRSLAHSDFYYLCPLYPLSLPSLYISLIPPSPLTSA
ncbi:hypothetical protein F4809DRAFT_629118 [Biscogniauxia mediterranea]|nr:hypothetical protein F4809DRAFT_629118 [Biscogniauxia mediterranea]